MASRNSLKHGMTAKKLALPNEDPAAIAARNQEWEGHFRPASPDARYLLEECVRATILADRFHRAHDTAVANQILDLEIGWERDRRKRVEALRWRLDDDPAGAVAELRAFPHGCRWLADRLGRLAARLDANGFWSQVEVDEVARLLGARPEPEQLHRDEEAYLLVLFNLGCQPEFAEGAIAALLQPGRRPEGLRASDRAALLPGPGRCLELLKSRIDEELDLLRFDEQRQRAGSEAEERARLLDPASILRDPDEARRFHRYRAEYRSTFHRAHQGLLAALKRDAAEDSDGTRMEAAGGDSCGSDEGGVGEVSVSGSDSRNEPSSETETLGDPEVVSPAGEVGSGPQDGPGPEIPATVEPVGSGSRNEPSPEAEIVVVEVVGSPAAGKATEDAGPREGRGSEPEGFAVRGPGRRSPLEVLAALSGGKIRCPTPLETTRVFATDETRMAHGSR